MQVCDAIDLFLASGHDEGAAIVRLAAGDRAMAARVEAF